MHYKLSGFYIPLLLLVNLLFSPNVFAQENSSIDLPDEFRKTLEDSGIKITSNDEVASEVNSNAVTALPLIYAENLNVAVGEKNAVSGSFTIKNYGGTLVSDIKYDVLLLGPEQETTENQLLLYSSPLYDRQEQDGAFSLAPEESKEVTFAYYPPQLPAGDYRVQVQLKLSTGRKMGWDTKPVKLSSTLSTQAYALLNGEEVRTKSRDYITQKERTVWSALEGVNVDANQEIVFAAKAQNTGTEPLVVQPVLHTTQILVIDGATQSTYGDTVTIAPGETKDITLSYTAGTLPGAFASLLSLNNSDGQRLSTISEFRHVVRGVSGSIVSAEVTAYGRKNGDTTTVAYSVVGPADRETNVEGSVVVALKDSQGELAQTISDVTLSADLVEKDATFPLTRDLNGDAILQITLRGPDGQELDTYEVPFSNVSEDFTATEKTADNTKSLTTNQALLIIGAVIAVLVLLTALLAFFVLRNKKPPIPPTTPLVILLLLSGAFVLSLYSPRVEATGYQNSIGWWNEGWGAPRVNLFVNRPIHGQYVEPGPVPYHAHISWIACENYIATGSIGVSYRPGGGWVTIPAEVSHNGFAPRAQAGFVQIGGITQSGYFSNGGFLQYAMTLPLGNFSPGQNTTIWTYGVGHSTYATGWSLGIVNDFTVVNFKAPAPSPTVLPPTPPPAPRPIVEVKANGSDGPITIPHLGSFHLTWNSRNAQSCQASGYPTWSGAVAPNVLGSQYPSGLDKTYIFKLTCSGPGGTASDAVQVNVSDNQAPIARITTQEACIDTNVSASGSTSSDPDGSISGYQWLVKDPQNGNVAVNTSARDITFKGNKEGNYQLRLTVTDNRGATTPANTTARVFNNPPVPVIEAKATFVGIEATIDGTKSYDPDKERCGHTITSYKWEVTDPSGKPVTVGNASAVKTTFTPNQQGRYSVKLTVTDSKGKASTKTDVVAISPSSFDPGDFQER